MPLGYSDFAAFAPSLPPSLAQAFMDTWVAEGDVDLALAAMRQHSDYEVYFAGNRRPDGSLRYDEGTYLSLVDAFKRTVFGAGVNPDVFDHSEYAAMIAGEKSPAEFADEVESYLERIANRGEAFIQEFAAVNGGIPITPQAALASLMSPRIDRAILERKITTAEIAAEGSIRGINIGLDNARRLFEFGRTGADAATLAGQATELIPAVDVLARRHLDPDDSFDLADFLEGFAFDNPLERQRVNRLIRREASSFSSQGGIVAASGAGLTGLEAE